MLLQARSDNIKAGGSGGRGLGQHNSDDTAIVQNVGAPFAALQWREQDSVNRCRCDTWMVLLRATFVARRRSYCAAFLFRLSAHHLFHVIEGMSLGSCMSFERYATTVKLVSENVVPRTTTDRALFQNRQKSVDLFGSLLRDYQGSKKGLQQYPERALQELRYTHHLL